MNSNEIVELARQKIDAEILELQEQIRSLRSSRNALAPMHSLPPEVMTHIFKWVQLLYRGEIDYDYNHAVSLPNWIRVTHVSKQWRNIARDSKSLYATILAHDLKYSKEVLKLSGSIPLTIIDSTDKETEHMWQNPELQELILAALPRVQKIWLGDGAADFLVPHLKKLNLPLEEFRSSTYKLDDPTFLPNASESLRHLQLTFFRSLPYDWLTRLSNLVDFELSPYERDSDKERLPVDDFLKILDAMPHLISLKFVGLLKLPSGPIDRVSPIRSQLQYFEARDNVDVLLELLPWLNFAPHFTCILKLCNCKTTVPVDWLSQLSIQMGQHLRSSGMVFRTAKLTWDNNNGTTRNVKTFLSEGVDDEREPQYQLFLSEPEKKFCGIWWESVTALPVGQVESLTVKASCSVEDWHSSPWHEIRSLRRLEIEDEQASLAFIDYLAESESEKKEYTSGGLPPFSSLEELTLHGIEYDRKFEARVRATLTSRMKKHDIKLRKLIFFYSEISDHEIERLSDVADVVERHGQKRRAEKTWRWM